MPNTQAILRQFFARIFPGYSCRPLRARTRRRPAVPAHVENLEHRTLLSASVVSIVLANPAASTTGADSVQFTVTFSEAVTGVDPTDFQTVETGTLGHALVQVAPVGVSQSQYTVTVSGISGNGTLGLNLVDNGSIRDLSNRRLVPASPANTFQSQQTYAAGASPAAIAAGDFNNDQIPDLLVANNSTSGGPFSVTVLRGNADGTFQAPQSINLGGVAGATQVVVGDINGDTRPDLVVAQQNRLVTLLGNVDGTFQTPVVAPAGLSNVFGIALANVDGDGDLDIVAAGNYSGSPVARVFLNDGNGTFTAAQTIAVGTLNSTVALGNFDSDANVDLAMTSGSAINILLGTGAGSFGAPQSFATGTQPNQPAVADFNGDGFADLVVANASGSDNSVSVLLGNGDGTFQAQRTFASVNRSVAVAAGDVNGDGRPDIVVSNANGSVNLLLGNGDGNFQAGQTFATGSNPLAILIQDLNGDTLPDLAVANSLSVNVSVLQNVGGSFTGPSCTIDNVAPSVTSIVRTTPSAATTNASSVTFTVTFSEAVSGVNAADFAVALPDGGNKVKIDKKLHARAIIIGGDGDDKIKAGNGHAVLVGGGGNDTLKGGDHNDILIGGTGSDDLIAKGEADLLIAGSTLFDNDPAALIALQMEWANKTGYQTRVQNLLNGTGTTGIRLQPDVTVFNDSSPDTLKGGQDKDWFLVDPRGDTIKGTDVDEIFTNLDM